MKCCPHCGGALDKQVLIDCYFVDGVAVHCALDLANAPEELTVVVDSKGNVDALDQPEDTIRDDEVAYMYRRKGKVELIHFSHRYDAGVYYSACYEAVDKTTHPFIEASIIEERLAQIFG